jgi:peptide/nickel transport system substrate-binding protein
MLSRRQLIASTVAAGAASPVAGLSPAFAATPQVLRVARTAADLPTVTGIPNNGGEGSRFLGYPVYDAVVNWDFQHTNETADVAPGLFTEWKIDPANNLRWICTVRKGVKFHDGSVCDADAIIWNFRRIFDEKAPQYDAPAAPIVRATVSMLDKFEKTDADTIVLTTTYPFSSFPYVLTRVMAASPARWEQSGKSWAGFAKSPSGTGPFKITRVVAGQYVEMSRFDDYWDKARVPKLDKMVVYPMPETTTRLAALRSGQVDWIEVPPPDAIPSLKAAGFQVSLWPYPHTYPYVWNVQPGSPFADVRVRQALNYALDRDGLCKLINDTGKPAIGLYPEESNTFGNPKNRYTYDPARAKALLAEAGYGPEKPLKAKIMISTAGSGQMVPIPMNEYIQQNMKAVNVDLDFDVVEWGTMLVAFRSPVDGAASHGVDAINISLSYTDTSSMFRCYADASIAPKGWNWGHYENPTVNDLLDKAQATFERKAQDELLAKAHAIIVDDAAWLFLVHDLNPRAMSKKVQGFKPAQSWAQDFTQITMSDANRPNH